MAKKKITDMTLLAAGSVAALDMIEIVDVSDTTDASTGTNKRLSIYDWLAAQTFGATGSFTAASGETVTVVNGLITAIEAP